MRKRILPIVMVAIALSPANGAGSQPGALALDALYSLPSLIGTAPSSQTWSPDSSRVAFLWNGSGGNFRDVWTFNVDDQRPLRLTSFPAPEMPAGDDPESIARREQAEQNAGVSAIAWFPDGQQLLATFHGEFYRVTPGRDSELLGDAGRQATFSPDGRHLAYVAAGEVQVAALEGTRLAAPRTLTGVAVSGGGVAGYRWSPDGRHLAVIERDMREVRRRAIPDYLTDETTVREVPRAFPGEEPGRTRLHVVDRDSGASRRMDLGPDDRDPLFTVQWSPDGSRLLVDKSDLYVEDRRLLSVDPTTGQSMLLHREAEPDNVMAFWSAAWAADSEGVWFLSDRDGFYHLHLLASAGSEPRAMTQGDWAVQSFAVAGDAIHVVGNREHPSRRDIYRLPVRGGEPVRLSGGVGTHDPVFSPDGRWAAVGFSSDAVPPDLYLNELSQPGEARVTTSPLPGFGQHEWITPRYVTFPSHVDGVTIHGRLMLPPDYDPTHRYPAIIGSIYSNTLRNQWGGRNAHPTWGLDQYLLQQGYVLLNVNIRGSWGLGREFRRRMQRDYGGIDVEDIYSGVQYLESLGSIDMDRIGLWGSSYGGLMTAMSLFTHPGVYAAGVAGAPATNVWHAMTGEMRVMDRPQDHPDEYADSSPFTKVSGLQDPLMIVHGMRDSIVLFKDSLVLLEHAMLHGKGHLIDFVPLPNAPHGWDAVQLYQTRYAFAKMVTFFDRHLKPGSD